MQFTREHSREETPKAACHIEDRRSLYRILKSWWCPYLFNVTCPDCNSTVRAEKRSWLCQKNKYRDYRRAKQKGVCFSTSERRRCSSIENDILLVGFGKIFKLCFFHLERKMFEGGYILILYWSTIFVQNNTMSVSQARLYWRIYISASHITEQDECSL